MSTPVDYLSLPLERFLEDVAARTPTPGGGSVAAAVGGLSAALARMALEFTVGKKKFEAHEPRLRQLLEELRRAGAMFGKLLSEDIAAYERYAEARKSGDPAEQARAMATATAVPLEIAALAAAVVERLDEVKSFANPVLYSDVQVAAILADATAEAAGLTARGNLPRLSDANEAQALSDRLDAVLSKSAAHRRSIVSYQPS